LSLPLLTAAQSLADSAYCGGKLILDGERTYDVIAKCGLPDSSESHDELVGDPQYGPVVRVVVEEWSYNFGPHDFIRLVMFRNGIVTSIRTGWYGYDQTAKSKRECDEHAIRLGESRVDVLTKCGEPAWRDGHDEAFSRGDRTILVSVEEWTYDFGPHRFIRILTFRNGKLFSIRSGEYGHM
jgi:hypothetical protein